MSSKRNKLLIFLGLVTVAVSKAHNQRFYGFESKRISASKHSANPRHIDSRGTDGFVSSGLPVKNHHHDQLTGSGSDGHGSQEPDKLTRRSLSSYSDLRTPEIVPNRGQDQISRRVGSLQQDSSDLSVEIDPQEFYFEARKVKADERKQKTWSNQDMPQESVITRRTGILNAGEEKPNPESDKKKRPTEVKAKDAEPKVSAKAIIVNDKISKTDSQEPSDKKATIKKKKPKIKKVLRVRVRGQKGNKTEITNAKQDYSKLTPKEKPKDDVLLKNQRSRSSKRVKFPEVKGSENRDSLKETSTKSTSPESGVTSNIPKAKHPKEVKISQVKKESIKDANRTPAHLKSNTALNEQKPRYSKEISFPESKIPTVVEDSVQIAENSPVTPHSPQMLEVYRTDKNSPSSAKKKTAETGAAKNKDPKENDQIGFFRRSGKKITGKTESQTEYPDADWNSMYRTENLNKDDNFYVLTFNYMGNKNEPIKDILYIPKVPNDEKKLRDSQGVLQSKSPHQTGEYPSPELNIHHLEQNAGDFLGRQRQPVKNDADDSSTYSHSSERNIAPLNDNNRGNQYYRKKVDSSDDLSIHDRRITEKQLSPKVTLKKKKTKNHKNPVWKLQVQKKNFPDDQWSQSRPSSHEAEDNSFRAVSEEHSEKLNNNGGNYFVRSFIKLPTGDNVDINLKNDDLRQNFHQEQYKGANNQRKPLLPAGNAGSGNYFVHMYKKVGDIENFDIRTGDNTDNTGYMSSLKLSWTDDDRRAQVDEAVDSRAGLPNVEHYHSNEHISSREHSNEEEYAKQPSENIMEYKHHYVDDFMSPLNDDKSYFYPDVPITHRLKRSTDTTPRVTTHFRIGESKVESNYTLDQTPGGKFLAQSSPSLTSKLEVAIKPIFQDQSPRMSGLPDSTVSKQKDTSVKSYYLKSNENKELNPLKMEFRPSDIFNKYENPSRGVANVPIFQSYQSPNRDPKRTHDMTYFHNDKNGKIKIHITDKATPFQTHSSQSNGTAARNSEFNNFKFASSGVIPSSTDIKTSYLKPENEANLNNPLNQSHVNTKVFHVNNTLLQKESSKNPIFQHRMDQTTMMPATASLTTISKMRTESMKTMSDKTETARTPENRRTKPTSTEYFSRITKSGTTILSNRPATIYTATTVPNSPTIKPTETTTSNRPTVKFTATTVPIRPQVKSTATTAPIRPQVKSTATTVPIRPQVKSTATTVPIRQVKSTATVPIRSAVKSTPTTVPVRPTVKYTATTVPIRPAVKSTPTVVPHTSTTKATTQSNRMATKYFATATSERTTKFTKPDLTLEKTTKLTTPVVPSGKITKSTTTAAQFFHKKGDINTKIDGSSSNTKPRRIDDKAWLYPQREIINDKHELQAEAGQHLESNSVVKNRVNGPEVIPRNNDFEHSSNGIDPQVSFQWQDPLHSVSEQNYPKYHSIPKTRFTCRKRAPGYYADPETGCQVFHMCQGTGVKHSFLCPNTTIFNQRLLVCDWYSKVTCDNSESFYTANNDIHRYQPEQKNNFKPEPNQKWNRPQNQNIVTTKYSQPNQENYVQNNNQVIHSNSYTDSEVTDMPQFIVNHFKENIPRAEFGKPKSVTKSYSTVIATPKIKLMPTMSTAKHSHRSNEKANPVFPQKLTNTDEKLIPDAFLEKQRAINSRWNTKDSERTLNHELSAPEPHKTHHAKHLPYSTPSQDELNHESKNYHSPEKNKVTPSFVNNGNSYYVPNIRDENRYKNEEDDEIHFAGRQNGKVIVVNRNRLYPEYEPTERPGLKESDKRIPGESLTKFTHSVPTTKTPYRDFSGTKILSHDITPQTHSNFQNQKLNNGGTSSQAPRPNIYHPKEVRNQKQNYNGARIPQYIYPLPGIVQNNDGSREFNYGYRVEDPKAINLPNPEILPANSPKSNNNILMKPEREILKSNRNILIKPEIVSPRFNKNILPNPQIKNPRFNKNIHIEPNNDTPRFNKNTNIGSNNETPRFNKNTNTGSNNETPRFNKNIHIISNSENPRFIKNIHAESNNETPFNKNTHTGLNEETPRFNKNLLLQTGSEDPGFKRNVLIKPDPSSDPQAGKIKWRIAEIKSGIESLGAQVGKILDEDENAFKNVRIFKLKPESSSGELEEIRLTPFKSERYPRIPQNSKTIEEKREKLSISTIKTNPNHHENANLAFQPNIRVQPINGGKRYEGNSNFRLYATENTGSTYNTPRTSLPVQKLVEQVVRDIVPKHKETSKLPPKPSNYETRTQKFYDQIVKFMPHNARTVNRSTTREMTPVGTHESVNINQYKQLLGTSGRANYDTEVKIPSKIEAKETPDKKYEVKYIPLIKMEKTTEPKVENKKLLREEEIRKSAPLQINQKSEHFDHVFVPKKIEGRYPEILYPKKIKVQESSESSEVRSTDLTDWKLTGKGMNEKYNFDSINKSDFRKSGDLPINNPQTKFLTTDHQVQDTSRPVTQKKDVRTFVVLTKPVPAAKLSNFESNKGIHYDNYKTILTPIQTKLQNMKENVDPSLECDDSSASSQNPSNTLTLQLGKNGPSQEFMKYIPLTKSSNSKRGTDNVRIYYNSGDESSSKCRNKGSNTSKNQDISIPESDEKTLNKKAFFSKNPLSKVAFKELKRPKYTYSPNKTPSRFNAKTHEENEQKMISLKAKPIKLFELQRDSRPAFTKPSSQKPTTSAYPESKVYFFPPTKTEGKKTLDESEDDSDKKSAEQSKRIASGKDAKYAELERAAELKTGIHNHENEKKVEAVNFSAARKGPQSKTVEKSEDSNESSSSHSRHSRYAEMEKAAELKALRMLRSKSRST